MNRFLHQPCSLPMIIIVIGGFILAGCIGTAPRIAGFSSPLELDATILCNETVSKPDGTKRNTPLCQEPIIPFSYPGSDERIVTFHLDTDRTDIGLWRFRVIAYRVSGLDKNQAKPIITTEKWMCDPHPIPQKPSARRVRIQCKDIPIPGKGEEVWLKASLDWIERVNLPNLGVPKRYITQDGTLSKQFAADLVAYHQCLKRGRRVPGAGSKLQHSVAPSSQSYTPTNGTTCTPPHNLWKGGPQRLVTWFKVKAPN